MKIFDEVLLIVCFKIVFEERHEALDGVVHLLWNILNKYNT